MRKNKTQKFIKAQSTLEYLIGLAVIIAILVAVGRTIMRPALEQAMGKLGNAIKTAADNF
jgi:hypothetical protein